MNLQGTSIGMADDLSRCGTASTWNSIRDGRLKAELRTYARACPGLVVPPSGGMPYGTACHVFTTPHEPSATRPVNTSCRRRSTSVPMNVSAGCLLVERKTAPVPTSFERENGTVSFIGSLSKNAASLYSYAVSRAFRGVAGGKCGHAPAIRCRKPERLSRWRGEYGSAESEIRRDKSL